MICNYHTHTPHCGHAQGTPREYIENAIKAGFTTLGFSDHVPYPTKEGHVSTFRMPVSHTKSYVSELVSLRNEYSKDIKILIGYEAEYYPAHFKDMLDNILSYECDYLIMGQHFTGNEYDSTYSGYPHEDPSYITKYVDQVIEGLSTGEFTYVAHPDIVRCDAFTTERRNELTRMFRFMAEKNIPAEINLLGVRESRHYPSSTFFEAVAAAGCKVILGLDAHNPGVFNNPEPERYARALAKQYGIEVVENVEPVKPHSL